MEHLIIFYYIISIAAGTAGTTLFFLESNKSKKNIFKSLRWPSMIFSIKILFEGIFSYITLDISANKETALLSIYIQTFLNILLFYSAVLFLDDLLSKKINRYIKFIYTVITLATIGVIFIYGKVYLEEKAIFSYEFYTGFIYIGCTGIYLILFYTLNRNSFEDKCMERNFHNIEKWAVILIPLLMIDIVYYMKGGYLKSEESIRFYFYPLVYMALLIFFISYTIKKYYILNKKNKIDYIKLKSEDEIFDIYGISVREKEVLNLMFENLTGNEIAEKLYISLSTVKTHTSNIYKKFEVKNRSELIRKIENLKRGE